MFDTRRLKVKHATSEAIWNALSDPTRRAIIGRVARGPTRVTDIATPPASSPSTAPTESRMSSVDGVLIHYVAEASGPAVVLAHCLGCNLHYWDVVAAEASPHLSTSLGVAISRS